MTFGSTFFRDFSSSENKIIEVQKCYFIFRNLGAETGWEIISKNSTILLIQSNFFFESELKTRFRYFLKSSAEYLRLIFEESLFNLPNFDYGFFILNTRNTSILFSSLKVEDFEFKGSFLYILENEYPSISKEFEAMKINF